MKKIMLIAFAILVSFAPDTRGAEETTTPLPLSLEMMGSEEKFLDYCVSALPVVHGIKVEYDSTNGVRRGIQIPSIGTTQFVSYAEFRNFFTAGGMFLRGELLKRSDIASGITFIARTIYYFPEGDVVGTVSVLTNLGPLSGITYDSFYNVRHRFAHAVIPVPNLKRFSVQVNSDPSYSYTWTQGTQEKITSIVPPPLPELTESNYVVLNDWYSVAGARARFEFETPDQIRTYTQHGDAMSQTWSRMTHPSQLEVFLPKGSETTVEWSPDLLQWQSLTNLTWSLGKDHVVIPVNQNLPKAFFRVLPPR